MADTSNQGDPGGGGGVAVSEIELQNIRRIFQQFDADGSDSIDVDELKEVMASLGVLMDEHHLMELVEQVAAEGKTELSLNEFVNLITLWKEASQYKLFDGSGFKSLAQQHVEKALQARSFISDSPQRSAWDMCICIAAILYWIFVLLIDAFGHDYFIITGIIAGDAVLTALFVADAILCARTCYVEDVRLIDDPALCFKHYLTTWFFPDVLAAIPFDLILSLAGQPIAATVLRHFRLFKMLKIPWLWQSSGVVPVTSVYIHFYFNILPLFQLFLTLLIMVHGYAIGFVLVKQLGGNQHDPLMEDGLYPYNVAVYFVLYTLSTVGLGDVPLSGDGERWYAIFVLFGAMATNGIVVGKLVAIVQRADIQKERRTKLRETLAVLDHFSISRQLQEEILQFQAHVFEHNLGTAYEGIVSGLPNEMRANISLFVKMKLVTNVPLFVESHYMLRIAVAQSLQGAVARPEQYIVVHGKRALGLYFLAYGFADVFESDGAYDGTLRSGDFFGDGTLLGELAQPMSVKAITYCDLLVLPLQSFESILQRFPKFRRHVAQLRAAVASDASGGGIIDPAAKNSSGQVGGGGGAHDDDAFGEPPALQLAPPPLLGRGAAGASAGFGAHHGNRAAHLRSVITNVRATRRRMEALMEARKGEVSGVM